MHNKRAPYRDALTTFPIVALLCCVAFIGCPEATEMVDDVVQPTSPAIPTEETPAEPMPSQPEPVVATPEPAPSQPEPIVATPEPAPPLPAGTVVFIEPRQITSPAPGQQLQVQINIKGAADVTAYEVRVGFDPTALRYVGIENADYLPAGAFASPPQVTANSVYLAAVSVSGPTAAASGTLATLTFEVVSTKASTITLNDALLSDSNVTPLALKTADGKVGAP